MFGLPRFGFRLLLVLALSLLVVSVAFAQGGFISYGQTVTGAISDTSPVVLYTFQANIGDLVTVKVSASAPGLDPTLALLSPGGAALATNDNDPFSFNVGDARLSYEITEAGVYSLLVGGANNTRGNYDLRLFVRAGSTGAAVLNGAAQVDLAAGAQTLIVAGNPAATTPISIQVTPADAPYSVEVRRLEGTVLAVYLGLPSVSLTLPASASSFVIAITSTAPNAQGLVLITQGDTPAQVVAPLATEEAAVAPANVCSITPAAGAVNVRSGPGTEFSVLSTLQVGQFLEVVGQNNGWYVVTLPGIGQGWVAGSVATLSGPCGSLPTIAAPAAPVAQPTAIPAAGATATLVPTLAPGGQQPTATPPQQQPPTATPPPTEAAQVAPPDNNYVLVVPLDGSASLSDFVSFPNGDVEDVVSYDTSGLNPNQALPGGRGQLTISLVCSGTGTNFITFRIDGQNYTCGQTFLRTVNADSDTGAVRITATGADAAGTYVQWTLNATLPRL
jgi:hypothetical protein